MAVRTQMLCPYLVPVCHGNIYSSIRPIIHLFILTPVHVHPFLRPDVLSIISMGIWLAWTVSAVYSLPSVPTLGASTGFRMLFMKRQPKLKFKGGYAWN